MLWQNAAMRMAQFLVIFVCALVAIAGGGRALAQAAPGTEGFDPRNPPTQTQVMRGETLFTIAERTRSPLKALIQVNRLSPPYQLSMGQTLKLPPLKVHIVGVGETFAAIAARYSVDARSLAVFNRYVMPVSVVPGQRIILPPTVIDRLTGLEPQDLVDLLAAEMDAGRQVTGAVPGQIIAANQSGVGASGLAIAQPTQGPVLQGPATDGSVHRNPVPPNGTSAKRAKHFGPQEDGDGVTVAPRPLRSAQATVSPIPMSPKPQVAARTNPAPTKTTAQTPLATSPARQFIWPVVGPLAETFGTKRDLRTVDGIEIEAPEGTPFRAAEGGVVAYVGNQLPGYGWLVLIRHPDNVMSAYAYAQSVNVRERQNVARGQVIGLVGTTGRAPTPRLHFQIRFNTKPIDPLGRLPRLPRLV